MKLAHTVSDVVRPGQIMTEQLDILGKGDSVAGKPVMARIAAGKQCRPAGGADLVRRKVVLETGATRGKPVQIGCSGMGVAGTAQAVGTLLVGRDENDIGHGARGCHCLRKIPDFSQLY